MADIATTRVAAFGRSWEISCDASSKIAVYTEGTATLEKLVGGPNIPYSWDLVTTITDTTYVSTATTVVTKFRVIAGSHDAYYACASAPKIEISSPDREGAEDPFQLNGEDSAAAGTDGGAIEITGGTGYNATSGTGDNGGAVDITGGTSGTATTGTAGNGGAASVIGSAGGAASGAAGIGGDGGDASVTGGAGGAASDAASGVGGDGGDVTLTPGAGGASTGSTAGAPGKVKISGGMFNWNAAQVIDMADAAVTLTLVPGTPTGTLMTSNILRVDPNSAGASENLLLPPEADFIGMLVIVNTGGESIAVQNDAGGAIDTVATTEFGMFFCDGTAWSGMNVA